MFIHQMNALSVTFFYRIAVISFGLLRGKKKTEKGNLGKKMNTKNDLTPPPQTITNQTRVEGKMALVISKALREF